MPDHSFMRQAVTISTPARAARGRRAMTPPSRNMDAKRNNEWNTLVRRVSSPDLMATLVRAMAADSEIVLLDEPFTGLDSRNSKKAAEYILSEQRGRTVISVTHDMEMCKMLGAGICLLTSGKAVATIL